MSKETSKLYPKGTPKVSPKDLPKEASKLYLKETHKIYSKETPKDLPKETPKLHPKETPKASPKDLLKETSLYPKETTKDLPKEKAIPTPKEPPQSLSKDTLQFFPKEKTQIFSPTIPSCHIVNTPIDFYYILGSTPCHAVLLLIRYMGIDVNLKPISFEREQLKSQEFLKMNPQHTVPAINDNGFSIGESRAILCYLVDMYAMDDALYPKDPKQRAIVNQRLFFEAGTLDKAFGEYFHGKPAKIFEAFETLDRFLEGKEWVAGDKKTVADFSFASSVASIEVSGLDVGQYPNVFNWFNNVQKSFPGYDEIVRQGCTVLKSYLDSLKQL